MISNRDNCCDSSSQYCTIVKHFQTYIVECTVRCGILDIINKSVKQSMTLYFAVNLSFHDKRVLYDIIRRVLYDIIRKRWLFAHLSKIHVRVLGQFVCQTCIHEMGNLVANRFGDATLTQTQKTPWHFTHHQHANSCYVTLP